MWASGGVAGKSRCGVPCVALWVSSLSLVPNPVVYPFWPPFKGKVTGTGVDCQAGSELGGVMPGIPDWVKKHHYWRMFAMGEGWRRNSSKQWLYETAQAMLQNGFTGQLLRRVSSPTKWRRKDHPGKSEHLASRPEHTHNVPFYARAFWPLLRCFQNAQVLAKRLVLATERHKLRPKNPKCAHKERKASRCATVTELLNMPNLRFLNKDLQRVS